MADSIHIEDDTPRDHEPPAELTVPAAKDLAGHTLASLHESKAVPTASPDVVELFDTPPVDQVVQPIAEHNLRENPPEITFTDHLSDEANPSDSLTQDASTNLLDNAVVAAIAPGIAPETATEIPPTTPGKSRRWLWWLLGVTLFLGLCAGGVFAYYYYDHYIRESKISEILPGGSHVALRVTINADAQQYTLLEDVMERIPGYHIIKKQLDDSGTGRSLSEHLRATLAEHDFDYDADIKNVLADDAIILIPDIMPLGDTLRERIPGMSDITTIAATEQKSFWRSLLEKRPSLSQADASDIEEGEPLDLDFIMAAKVKNLAEAKRVLSEMSEDSEDYTVHIKKAHGLSYVHLSQIVEGESSVLGIGDLYHALVGGYWIVSTHEIYVTDALARKRDAGMFRFLNSQTPSAPLSTDEEFLAIDKALHEGHDASLVSGYVNVNLQEFSQRFAGDDGLGDPAREYIKYPERYTAGVALRVDTDGFVVSSVSKDDRIAATDIENSRIGQGLTEKVPTILNEKFADVYIEYDNVRSLYYVMKDSALTDAGREKVNEARELVVSETGIDFESDLVDIFEGASAFVLFSRAGLAPEAASLTRVSDPERAQTSIQKIVDYIKSTMGGDPEALRLLCEERNVSNAESGAEFDDPDLASFFADEDCAAVAANAQAVADSAITATETAAGTIYSYKLPSQEDVSFDFGFAENTLILATNFATVESMLAAFDQNSTAPKLATDAEFQGAFKDLRAGGFAVTRVKFLGLVNSLLYTYDYFTGQLEAEITDIGSEAATLSPEFVQAQEEVQAQIDDIRFLMGAYARAIDTSASISTSEHETGNFIGGSRVEIKSLPAEDLMRANAILDGL